MASSFSVSREKIPSCKKMGKCERDGPWSPLKILRGGAFAESTGEGPWEVRGLEGAAPRKLEQDTDLRVLRFLLFAGVECWLFKVSLKQPADKKKQIFFFLQ